MAIPLLLQLESFLGRTVWDLTECTPYT